MSWGLAFEPENRKYIGLIKVIIHHTEAELIHKNKNDKGSDLAYSTHVHKCFLGRLLLVIGAVALLFLQFCALFCSFSLRLYLLLSTSHSENKKNPSIKAILKVTHTRTTNNT